MIDQNNNSGTKSTQIYSQEYPCQQQQMDHSINTEPPILSPPLKLDQSPTCSLQSGDLHEPLANSSMHPAFDQENGLEDSSQLNQVSNRVESDEKAPEICRVLLVPYKTKQEIEAASEDFTGCPDDFEIIYLDQETNVDDLLDYKKTEGFHDVLVVNPRVKSMRFYFCGICKLKILTLNDMLRHVIAKHFNFRWKCDICEKTFSRASDRKRHFKNVHESNGVRYVCSQCHMVFDESTERDDHIRIIHDGGKIPCVDLSNNTLDGESGSAPSSTNSSLLIVSSICSTCDESFDNYQTLDKHRREDHKFSPLYLCYTCSERFTTRHILRMHRTGSHVIRSCPACKASFKRSIDLKRHFKRAHPQELPNFPSLALDHNEEARQVAAQQKNAASSQINQRNPVKTTSTSVPGIVKSEPYLNNLPKFEPSFLLNNLMNNNHPPMPPEDTISLSVKPPLDYFTLTTNLINLLLSANQNRSLSSFPGVNLPRASGMVCSLPNLPPAPLGMPQTLINSDFQTTSLSLPCPLPISSPSIYSVSSLVNSQPIKTEAPTLSIATKIAPKPPSLLKVGKMESSSSSVKARCSSVTRSWKGAVEYQNRAFQCDVCSSRFTRNYHLQRHMRTVHSISEFYKCAHCTAKYGNRVNLENHFLSAHAKTAKLNGLKKISSSVSTVKRSQVDLTNSNQTQDLSFRIPGSIPLEEMGMKIDSLVSSPRSSQEIGDLDVSNVEQNLPDYIQEETKKVSAGFRQKSLENSCDAENSDGQTKDHTTNKRRRKSLLPKKHLLHPEVEEMPFYDPYDSGMISS